MRVIGLTGGIGSGKSTVGELLASHGAFLIDADVVAREVVGPKTPGLDAIVRRFGEQFLTPSGVINRRKLSELVFSDKKALSDLNAIVHPLVRASIEETMERIAVEAPQTIVVLMVPLLVESGTYPVDAIIVVDCEPDVALRRLTATRGLTEQQVRSRMAAQLTRQERNAHADFIINNSGAPEDLPAKVDAAWQWILERGSSRDGRLEGPNFSGA